MSPPLSRWFLVSLVPNTPALFIEANRCSDSCPLRALGKLPAFCRQTPTWDRTIIHKPA
jgi:hypothetical protein